MRLAKVYCNFARSHLKTAFAQITCTVFMDKRKSKVRKCSVYFNKIMKSKHMLAYAVGVFFFFLNLINLHRRHEM